MAELRTRNTPDWIIKALDEIVEKEMYENRQELVNHILELYVSSRSRFFTSALPDVVRELCEASIEEQNNNLHSALKNVAITYAHIADTVDELRSLLLSADNDA